MRQTSHLYGSALFTIPLIYLEPLQGDKKNVFVLDVFFFFKKESNVFLDFQIFLSNLPAIDVKHLLKLLAMMCSSDIVILSILRVSF